MKTPEELNALKAEVEALNKKLAELTEDELMQVAGGNEFYGLDNEEQIFEPGSRFSERWFEK